MANTSAFVGEVQVTLLFDDGTTGTCGGGQIPGNSRTTYFMGDCTVTWNRKFGALVESLPTANGTALIVVERAMYSTANGIWWAAGTDAVATKIR